MLYLNDINPANVNWESMMYEDLCSMHPTKPSNFYKCHQFLFSKWSSVVQLIDLP